MENDYSIVPMEEGPFNARPAPIKKMLFRRYSYESIMINGELQYLPVYIFIKVD